MHVCWGEGEGRKGIYVKKKESVHTKTGSSTHVSETEQCSIHVYFQFLNCWTNLENTLESSV